jgi:hypothetical protein
MKSSLEDTLLASIRTIPDYPKPGILFRDITTLLGNARARCAGAHPDRVRGALGPGTGTRHIKKDISARAGLSHFSYCHGRLRRRSG